MRRSVLVLAAAALLGCAEADPAAGGPGGPGGAGGAPAGAGGTVVENSGRGGSAEAGTGSAGASSAAGAGGAPASGGHGGTTGAAGITGGAGAAGEPPTCEALGWRFGSASLCGGTIAGHQCASCGTASDPQPAVFKNCISATAAQNTTVLCIDARTACGVCN